MDVSLPGTIGFDIGGTSIRAAFVDSEGNIPFSLLSEKRERDTFNQLRDIYQQICFQIPELSQKITGVGIGLAGNINSKGVLVSSPTIPDLKGVNVSREFHKIFDVPAQIINDGNAATLGEWLKGAAVGARNCALITVGTGIGGGLIIDRSLISGADSAAGEMGHIVMVKDGPPCPCGGRGCLEQFASGTVLETRIRSRLKREEINGEVIVEGAYAGNQFFREELERIGHWLGVAISTLTNLLNLDVVVIGGGLSEAFQLFEPELSKQVIIHTMPLHRNRLRVVKGSLGSAAGVIGAAVIARSNSAQGQEREGN